MLGILRDFSTVCSRIFQRLKRFITCWIFLDVFYRKYFLFFGLLAVFGEKFFISRKFLVPRFLGNTPPGFSPNPFPQGGKLLFSPLNPFSARLRVLVAFGDSASGGLEPFFWRKRVLRTPKKTFCSLAHTNVLRFSGQEPMRTLRHKSAQTPGENARSAVKVFWRVKRNFFSKKFLLPPEALSRGARPNMR